MASESASAAYDAAKKAPKDVIVAAESNVVAASSATEELVANVKASSAKKRTLTPGRPVGLRQKQKCRNADDAFSALLTPMRDGCRPSPLHASARDTRVEQ